MTLLKLARKNITSRPGRFLLTSLAVLVGVALTSAVFVFTDSLRETFGSLSDDIESGYDIAVRSEVPFGDRLNAAPVGLDVPAQLADIDGVQAVQPRIIEFGIIANDAEGEAALATSGPNIGVNWESESPVPRLFLADGAAPTAADDFALDVDAAADDDFIIGDRYEVQTPAGLREMTLTGTFFFAAEDENALVGAKLVAFETSAAVELLNEGLGYDDVTITLESGADEAAVISAVDEVIAGDLEVLTREAIADEQAEDFNEFIDIFRTILLVFAFIILLVAAFIIYNVFSIIVGQRIQEIGLLRSLGATGRQITRSIAAEALGVGVFATITGILLGLPLAFGLQKLLASLDFGPDDASTPLRPTTIIVGAALGIGLTLAAAIWPALRARSVSPMAALRNDVALDHEIRPNPVMGALLTVAGIAMVILGFALDEYIPLLILCVVAGIFLYLGLSRINLLAGRLSLVTLAVVLIVLALTLDLRASMLLALLGASALISFLGINLLSPLFARPAARAIGAPLAAVGKVPSQMARENAGRSPDRTATAASALMIGLALVTTVAVVAESFKATFAEVLREAVAADWIVTADQNGPQPIGFTSDIANDLAADPSFTSVLAVQWSQDALRTPATGDVETPYSLDLSLLDEHFDIGIIDRDDSLFGTNAVLLHEDEADDRGLAVGDTFEVEFNDQSTTDAVVAAVFDDLALFDSGWAVDTSFFTLGDNVDQPEDIFVTMITADGVSEDDARESIAGVIEGFSQLESQTKAEFQDDAEQSINQVLSVITVLLMVSIVLAVLGVAITLALSVIERTREIGLTRAVGATRRQVKRMVRVEGIIVAMFGGLLGVGLGVVFGLACVQIIPDDFVSDLAIPWGSLISYLVVAAIAGLIAAYFPARRASKLNVLDAIAHGG